MKCFNHLPIHIEAIYSQDPFCDHSQISLDDLSSLLIGRMCPSDTYRTDQMNCNFVINIYIIIINYISYTVGMESYAVVLAML